MVRLEFMMKSWKIICCAVFRHHLLRSIQLEISKLCSNTLRYNFLTKTYTLVYMKITA